VLVDSPPGAGKTYLVEMIGALAVGHFGWRVAIVTPKKSQSYDFLSRFVERFPQLPVQLLHGPEDAVPDGLRDGRVVLVHDAKDLHAGASLIVGTIDKLHFATHKLAPNECHLLVVDEAYQCTYRQAFPLFSIARQLVMVGDPGQLSPFSEIDEERFEGARDHVHWALPRELLRTVPGLIRYRLPVTHRLPGDTVAFVQPSFYPDLPFTSAVDQEERQLAFAAAGLGDRIDRALDAIEGGSTIVGIALPALHYQTEVDEQLSGEVAAIVERLDARQTLRALSHERMNAGNIGYCDTHVASGTVTRNRLDANRRRLAFADTPEVIQGRQTDIMIVKHPLSGLTAASSFDLDPGRLCVMLSRHRSACIVLARDDVSEVLHSYEHDCGERLAGHEDVVWSGYLAHRSFWDALERQGRIFR
jgi:hypothetical protein